MSADAFKLAINAFEQMDGVSVFSNPKIIVANEETAKVDMTTKEPNVEMQYQAATSQNGSDSITTKLGVIPGKEEPFVGEAFFSYGISLKVTPRISPAGLITVEIEPSISDFVKYFELQGINSETPSAKFPVIKMQRLKTSFTMNDGKTAVIGGLTRTTEESTDSGIPWLNKLPWIGPRIFGWKSRDKEQREIIVFVTVGIADPVEMKEDVGLPKNALLGRELMNGTRKEPGDRTREELLRLDEPRMSRLNRSAAPAEKPEAEGTEAAAAKSAQ
jgi:general secretion pathway protein D